MAQGMQNKNTNRKTSFILDKNLKKMLLKKTTTNSKRFNITWTRNFSEIKPN